MLIVKLTKKNQQQVLELAVDFLKAGKVIVYPTDTIYGLGADALNAAAVRKIYLIKVRSKNQPIHVLLPSIAAAKKLLQWSSAAQTLADNFLPGPLSIALPLKTKNKSLAALTAGSGALGFRLPKNNFSLELAKKLRRPITATSANPSHLKAAGFDPYSAKDVIRQFRGRKYQPNLIIDAGQMPRCKPSTFVRILPGNIVEILRPGPVSRAQIQSVL